MFGKLLVFPDTAWHAWLTGLPMYGHMSDFQSVLNCEVVWCNNCATLLRQTAIFAVKSVTSLNYTGSDTVDFHIVFGTFVINHGLFKRRDRENGYLIMIVTVWSTI